MQKRLFILFIFGIISGACAQNIANVKIKDLNGKTVAVRSHLDCDATIVLFWATWCLPCQKELPAVQKIVARHADKNIHVLAVSRDSPRSLAKVKAFVKRHNYPFTYLLDADGAVSADLMVDAIPHSLIVDKQGKIVYSHTGYRRGDELDLEKALLTLWKK